MTFTTGSDTLCRHIHVRLTLDQGAGDEMLQPDSRQSKCMPQARWQQGHFAPCEPVLGMIVMEQPLRLQQTHQVCLGSYWQPVVSAAAGYRPY